MSNHIDLADCFQSLGFHEDRLDYHELTIEYPVLDLILPEADISPCLRPPQNIEFREQPDASKYHLPLTGTDFKLHIPLNQTLLPAPSNCDLTPISLAMHSLYSTPGRSLLQIASYSSPSDGDSHIFRLLTEDPASGQYMTVAETDFSSLEWEAERTVLKTDKWTRLANDLLNRSSDRAYFHVHEKLKFYSWYRKSTQSERWGSKDDVLHAEIADPTSLFPCGHVQQNTQTLGLTSSLLTTKGEEEDATPHILTCQTCASISQPLSKTTLRHLRLFQESRHRAGFLSQENF